MVNRRILLYLFLLFMSLYSFFSIGHFGGDGYNEYLTAESIVLDGNTRLYDRPNDPDQLKNFRSDIGIKARNGDIYSARSCLGVSLPLSVFYALGHIIASIFKNVPHDFVTMLVVSFYNPFITASTVLFIFIISIHLGFKHVTSLILSMIYGFSTMIPVYARAGFAEPTLALSLLISVYWVICYSKSLEKKFLIYSALFLSYCILTKAVAFLFFPCFLIYILWCIFSGGQNLFDGFKAISLYVFVFLFSNIFVFIYNYYIYGSIFNFGGTNSISVTARVALSTHFLKGAYYYLLSPGKSLILFNLPIILSFIGLVKVSKGRRKETVLFLLIFVVNLIFFVRSFRRGSLYCWGPRYLFLSLPFLVLLIGNYYEGYRNYVARAFLWFLSFAGFIIMLPCMFVNQSKFYMFVVEKLKQDEYLINFIPDLSPIKGAWCMFISRIAHTITGNGIPFNYAPDYKLVKPVSALMEKYNHFDLWFLAVIKQSPQFAPAVFAVLVFLVLLSVVSAYKVCGLSMAEDIKTCN